MYLFKTVYLYNYFIDFEMNYFDFLFKNDNKSISLLITLFGLAAVIASFALEHLLKLQPCILCLIQRYLLVAVFFIGIVTVFKSTRKLIVINILLLVATTLTAGYHVAVEKLVISEAHLCRIVEVSQSYQSCGEVSFTFLGFSLAEWNLTIITGLVMIILNKIMDRS